MAREKNFFICMRVQRWNTFTAQGHEVVGPRRAGQTMIWEFWRHSPGGGRTRVYTDLPQKDVTMETYLRLAVGKFGKLVLAPLSTTEPHCAPGYDHEWRADPRYNTNVAESVSSCRHCGGLSAVVEGVTVFGTFVGAAASAEKS